VLVVVVVEVVVVVVEVVVEVVQLVVVVAVVVVVVRSMHEYWAKYMNTQPSRNSSGCRMSTVLRLESRAQPDSQMVMSTATSG